MPPLKSVIGNFASAWEKLVASVIALLTLVGGAYTLFRDTRAPELLPKLVPGFGDWRVSVVNVGDEKAEGVLLETFLWTPGAPGGQELKFEIGNLIPR